MKIRNGYVSNSSSSSYVISCKGKELAEFVMEAYGKLFDLWMELNPDDIGYGLERINYHLVTVDEIIEHFKYYNMNQSDLKYNKEGFEKEAKEGYVFLLGNCSSEDGTCEQNIMDMFNEYLLSCCKGRYDWKKEQYKNDIDLVFQTIWS